MARVIGVGGRSGRPCGRRRAESTSNTLKGPVEIAADPRCALLSLSYVVGIMLAGPTGHGADQDAVRLHSCKPSVRAAGRLSAKLPGPCSEGSVFDGRRAGQGWRSSDGAITIVGSDGPSLKARGSSHHQLRSPGPATGRGGHQRRPATSGARPAARSIP